VPAAAGRSVISLFVCVERRKNGMDRPRNDCVRWRLNCRRKMPRYRGFVFVYHCPLVAVSRPESLSSVVFVNKPDNSELNVSQVSRNSALHCQWMCVTVMSRQSSCAVLIVNYHLDNYEKSFVCVFVVCCQSWASIVDDFHSC